MFEPVRISPSILSADFMNLASELASIQHAGADWAHVDVMDGHFVPNLTIGVPVLAQLANVTSLPLDVHLMISNPLEQLPWYVKHNPAYITIHWEALAPGHEVEQAHEAVKLIHANGISRAGIALKPDTDTSVLQSTIDMWDMVLVMSVFPGFSGQAYIPESAGRVAQVAAIARDAGVAPLIQVDGGINGQTAAFVGAHGADVLVAGNAVFKAPNRAQAVHDIRTSAIHARKGA